MVELIFLIPSNIEDCRGSTVRAMIRKAMIVMPLLVRGPGSEPWEGYTVNAEKATDGTCRARDDEPPARGGARPATAAWLRARWSPTRRR